MAKDWYWTVALGKDSTRIDPEEWPSMVDAVIGSPPFLGARELDEALEFNFEPDCKSADLEAQLREIEPELAAAAFVWRQTEVKPYLEDYWNRLKPLAVGDKLMIIPREGLDLELNGRLPIHLEPGMAFGTGDHFTTSYCLRRLEWAAAHLSLDAKVLDLGTGSGILAIGAHRLGFRNLDAVDVDPNSIVESAKNFARNDVTGVKLFAGSIHTCNGPYDLIVANLFADLLVALEAPLKEKLAPGGAAIFSGISAENLPKMDAVFTARRGWEPLDRDQGEGWCGLTFRRK